MMEFKKNIYQKVWRKVGGMWRICCNFDPENDFYIDVRMRFLGNIEAKTDVKGRAFLPVVFRKELQQAGEEALVLRKDVFQDCLVLYPESVWNSQMDELRHRLNRWNAAHQQVYRQFVSEVERITLDGNGRFLIPKRYLKMAAIVQEIKFIGMGDTIEIWSKSSVEEQLMKADEFKSAIENLMEEHPWEK